MLIFERQAKKLYLYKVVYMHYKNFFNEKYFLKRFIKFF